MEKSGGFWEPLFKKYFFCFSLLCHPPDFPPDFPPDLIGKKSTFHQISIGNPPDFIHIHQIGIGFPPDFYTYPPDFPPDFFIVNILYKYS